MKNEKSRKPFKKKYTVDFKIMEDGKIILKKQAKLGETI
jgi:hypothetical protein